MSIWRQWLTDEADEQFARDESSDRFEDDEIEDRRDDWDDALHEAGA